MTGRWRWFLWINGALVLSIVAARIPGVPGPLRMLFAALPVLVLPGAAWLGLFRKRELDPARAVLAVVGISSLSLLGGMAVLAFSPGGPYWILLPLWTALVANLGIIVGGEPGRLAMAGRWSLFLAVSAAGFVVFALSALYLVPPLEDHDMEVRGTAYGLAADLKPYFLTNRELLYQFSHPVLFNAHVAGSLVFTGEIDDTRPSYDSARRAEDALSRGEAVPWMEMWESDYREFIERPALAGTRAPAVLMSALVLGLLADLVSRLAGGKWAGIAAAALYLSCPETLVRSVYAGYFAATVLAMLVAAMLFERSPSRFSGLGWFAAAGALAALVDHKTVVLVLGAAGLVVARAAWDLLRGEIPFRAAAVWAALDRRVIALGGGFSLATFAWWGYGLAVDSPAFIRDHLRMHIAHRMLLNDLRLSHDAGRYAPSITELWVEFAAHTGYLFLPVALVAALAWIFTRGEDDRRAILATWFLAGMVAFTLTDWRQTKHLMNQLAPMAVAATAFAWPVRRGWRILILILLAVALGFNLAADWKLVNDFSSLTVLGASDVDGW